MSADWTEQATQMFKMWTDGQKAWLESLARGPAGAFGMPGMGGATTFGMPGAGAQLPGVPNFAAPFASSENVRDAARQMNDAWKASIDQWMGLLQRGSGLAGTQEHVAKS